jgi:hypothetical protein
VHFAGAEDEAVALQDSAIPMPSFSLVDILSHKIKILLKFGNVETAKSINQVAQVKYQNRG